MPPPAEIDLGKWFTVAFFSILALAAGAAGGYFYERDELQAVIAIKEIVINDLRTEIAQYRPLQGTGTTTVTIEEVKDAEATVRAPGKGGKSAGVDTGATSTPLFPTFATENAVIHVANLPKKGQRLCRGEQLEISWAVDPLHADEIRIGINSPVPIAPLFNVPATWNETGTDGEGVVHWKIGSAKANEKEVKIPDGELYRISVYVYNNGEVVDTKDSGLFAIDTCEG